MDDYEIGYRKPPKAHQFPKGQSGNPRGRPRRPVSTDDSEIIRRLDAEEITVAGRTITRREAEIHRIFALSLKGNRKALRLIERFAKSIVKPHPGGVVRIPWDEFEKRNRR
jgi:hypothetical protein